MKILGSIKDSKFSDQLTDCQSANNYPVPYSKLLSSNLDDVRLLVVVINCLTFLSFRPGNPY